MAFAHVGSSPPRPARSSPSPLPIPTTSAFAAIVAPEPSPAVRSAVIDIFSPRPPQPPEAAAEGEGAMVGASGMSSLTSERTARADEAASQASGGAGGGATSAMTTTDTGSSNSNSRPKVRKKATFSDMVTTTVAALQPSESMGKDESLGGRSGVTTTTGAGSLVGMESEDEDGESIVAIKHKLTLLEKQQDVEKFSIERYTSRLITFWCVRWGFMDI